MRRSFAVLLALVTAAALVVAVPAFATTIEVTPWLAANASGSPSFTQAEQNADTAMHDGLSAVGSGPSQFKAQTSPVTADQVIVTDFNSWMGKVDPGTVFGAAYANELGNRMTFALRIDGQGSQFSISQLSFVMDSSDTSHQLAYGFSLGSYNYSTGYEGVLKGADGHLWTADDVFVTSGLNTQLVDGLIGRGSGNSMAAYCSGCDLAAQQAALDAAALGSLYDGPFTFTGTYTLGDATGSASFSVISPTPVPEPKYLFPSALALLIGVMAYRKKKQGLPLFSSAA